MNVLNKIDQLREARGWSVNKLAKESGLKQSTLQNLYDRNSAPTIATLEKICSALGVSFKEFFCDSTEKVFTEQQKKTIELWGQLTSEQKKALLPVLIEKI